MIVVSVEGSSFSCFVDAAACEATVLDRGGRCGGRPLGAAHLWSCSSSLSHPGGSPVPNVRFDSLRGALSSGSQIVSPAGRASPVVAKNPSVFISP